MTCRPARAIWTRAISRCRRRSRASCKKRPNTTWYGSSIPRRISATICCSAHTSRARWWGRKAFRRWPVERDDTSWLGGRALTDGIMRSGKTTPPEVKAFFLSDAFKLEGFKGQAMSFRTWDHQLRQPVILGGGSRVPVSTSPQEGFLHETNLTDTLGFDKPETKCKFPTQ